MSSRWRKTATGVSRVEARRRTTTTSTRASAAPSACRPARHSRSSRSRLRWSRDSLPPRASTPPIPRPSRTSSTARMGQPSIPSPCATPGPRASSTCSRRPPSRPTPTSSPSPSASACAARRRSPRRWAYAWPPEIRFSACRPSPLARWRSLPSPWPVPTPPSPITARTANRASSWRSRIATAMTSTYRILAAARLSHAMWPMP